MTEPYNWLNVAVRDKDREARAAPRAIKQGPSLRSGTYVTYTVQTKRFARHPQLRPSKIPLTGHFRRYPGRRRRRSVGKEAGKINVSRRTRRRAERRSLSSHPTERLTFTSGIQTTANLRRLPG